MEQPQAPGSWESRFAAALSDGSRQVERGDAAAAAATLRDALLSRTGALTLAQANECADLLGQVFAAGTPAEARGLAVVLYGQGVRTPWLILRAFHEFLDQGNAAQAARFVPWISRMPGPEAELALARLDRVRGQTGRGLERLPGLVHDTDPALATALRKAGGSGTADTLEGWARRAAAVAAALEVLDDAEAGDAVEAAAAASLVPEAIATSDAGSQRRLVLRLHALVHAAGCAGLASDSLGELFDALQRQGALAGLEPMLADARAGNPANAKLAMVEIRQLRRRLVPNDDLLAVLDQVPEGAPGWPELRDYVAHLLLLDADGARALALHERGAPTTDPDALMQVAFLREHYAGVVRNPLPGAAPAGRAERDEPLPLRLRPVACGTLADALRPLCELANMPLRFDTAPSADVLVRTADEALRHFQRHLRAGVVLAMDERLRIGAALARAATPVRPLAIYAELPGHRPGPEHGALDPERHRILYRSLHRHRYELLADGVRAATAGTGEVVLSDVIAAAEATTAAAIECGMAGEAATIIDDLLDRCGDAGRAYLLQLRERCGFSVEPPLTGGPSAHAQSGIVAGTRHRLLPFDAWADTPATGAASTLPGTFTTVDEEGNAARHPFEARVEPVVAVAMQDVVVRDSWLLLNAAGDLLQPPPVYRLSGDYPYASPHLLSRGRAGAALAPPAAVRCVDEPVVALANNDLRHHANYYHWTVHLLARILWAQQQGLLAGNRLLMPAETRPWMDDAMRLCGIGEDRILRYAVHETLRLRRAQVISPLGHAHPALLASLRSELHARAGVDDRTGAHRLFYLSRRAALRRALPDEVRLCAVAEANGFEVIQPETLSVPGQVALFSTARAVVAPAGAALANLVFARPGTRTLTLAADADNFPTFVELSIALGQPHRVLFGATDPAVLATTPPDDVACRVDADAFATQLRWAAGVGDD